MVEPQAFFAALARSMQFEWQLFLSWTFVCPSSACYQLYLLSSFIGDAVSEQEILLGIANCVDSASLAFRSSREGSTLLVNAIINHEKFVWLTMILLILIWSILV